MPPEDGKKGAAAAVGRFDVIAAPYAYDFRARQAGKAGYCRHPDRDGGVEGAEAEQNNDR